MADDLFPLDMHDGPVCEEEEEDGMPCEDEQVKNYTKAKKLKAPVSYCNTQRGLVKRRMGLLLVAGHVFTLLYSCPWFFVYREKTSTTRPYVRHHRTRLRQKPAAPATATAVRWT